MLQGIKYVAGFPKRNGKVVPAHSMKTRTKSISIAALIPNIGTRCRRVVNSTPTTALFLGKPPGAEMDRMALGSLIASRHVLETRITS